MSSLRSQVIIGLAALPVVLAAIIGLGYLGYGEIACEPLYAANANDAGWGAELGEKEARLLADIERGAPTYPAPPSPKSGVRACPINE